MERRIIIKRKVIVRPYRRNNGVKVKGYSYLRYRKKKIPKKRKKSKPGLLFCPKCGSILIPKREKEITRLYCPRCKTAIKSENYPIKTIIPHTELERTLIIEGPDETFTTIDYCPKCKQNVRIKTWQVQLRSSDEPSTTFYRCVKGHTWREKI